MWPDVFALFARFLTLLLVQKVFFRIPEDGVVRLWFVNGQRRSDCLPQNIFFLSKELLWPNF